FNVSVPRSYLYVICVSHRVNGRWTEPEIAPFSGHYRDSDPVLSPDGNRLYFVSDRPAPGKTTHDFDVWAVDRTTSGWGWGDPRNLGAPVNSSVNEYFASEASDGTLYFASARGYPTEARERPVTYDEIVSRSAAIGNGLGNIYEIPLAELGLPEVHLTSTAKRPVLTEAAASPPEATPAASAPKGRFAAEIFGEGVISTPALESGGAFTPDGKEFYFTVRSPTTTTRPVAAICVSRLRAAKWSKPEVASFSGRFFDYAPAISPDG